jgi:hypothetical protein
MIIVCGKREPERNWSWERIEHQRAPYWKKRNQEFLDCATPKQASLYREWLAKDSLGAYESTAWLFSREYLERLFSGIGFTTYPMLWNSTVRGGDLDNGTETLMSVLNHLLLMGGVDDTIDCLYTISHPHPEYKNINRLTDEWWAHIFQSLKKEIPVVPIEVRVIKTNCIFCADTI